ncbi:hypothetical protein DQ354_19205 [Arthrobacter sp. AQ5-06]|nr:hypothetical protein DQ354_19205 [Arthrobacter sp. AQ5-06]
MTPPSGTLAEIKPDGTEGSSLAIAADHASGESTNELKRGLSHRHLQMIARDCGNNGVSGPTRQAVCLAGRSQYDVDTECCEKRGDRYEHERHFRG